MSLNIGVGAGVGFNSVNGIGGGGGGYILDDFPNALGAFSVGCAREPLLVVSKG